MCSMTEREKNLKNALKICLAQIHEFFGLTDKEMDVALEEAATNPLWSCWDDKLWTYKAYPKKEP